MNWEELAQPYVTMIVKTLIGLLASMLFTVILIARKRVNRWLDTHITTKQKELIREIAEEAYAYSEGVFNSLGGPKKMNAALDYATHKLEQYGVKITTTEIRAAIQKAWTRYEGQYKKRQKVIQTE